MGQKQRNAHRTVRVCCLALLVLLLHGDATGSLSFERVGTESGPPPEVITTLYQDRAGFIWIGSRNGVTLYDGYSFTVFDHDPSDPTSLSGNTIRTIYEDSRGNLWFGTNTAGLNRLERATWEFEHFRHDSTDPTSLSHDSVYAILEDRSGALWVGTQVGLNRFDPETGSFDRLLNNPANPESLSHDYVYVLHDDTDGGLWIGTIGDGLRHRDPETGAPTFYRNDPDDPYSLSGNRVLALADAPAGGLWVATASGLNLLDRQTGTIRRIGRDEDDGPVISYPVVTALAPGPSGTLWIATHGGGLNRLDPATGEILVFTHDPARRKSLTSDEIVALLSDASGGLWIGTWGGGLNRLSPGSLLLSESGEPLKMPEDLESDNVTAVTRDRAGGIWLGTRSGDVVRVAPEGRTDHHLNLWRIILGLAEDPSGRIWIATNVGLTRLDPNTGEQVSYEHAPEDPTSLGPGYVVRLLIDRSGRLWAGTGEGGLQRLDADGRVVARFVHDADDPGSLSDDYVSALFEDARGTLWVGTRSGGLNALDPRTGTFVRHIPEPGDTGSLSHHYVTSIFEDSAGTLWVGTSGGGLNRVDRLDEGGLTFTRFTEAGGLVDDDVMGIQQDDDGSLWVSTRRGLSRFDPKTSSFANFDVADGLPSGEFESGAVVRGENALYFGNVGGLIAIPAGTPFPEPTASPTVIVAIRTSSGELGNDRPVWDLERLQVAWGEWLSLKFAVLDYSAGRTHGYQYRLAGVSEDWIDLGPTREITFTALDPGIYEFNIRGRNSQGVWSLAEPTLRIQVVPPFWMTAWFRAAAALFVVSSIVVTHRLRINAVKRRNRELVAHSRQVEKARRELDTAYKRLARLTRRLEAAKEDERRTIARELHDEMGQALTAVKINLRLISDRSVPDDVYKRVLDTVGMVDEIIRQVRDLSLNLSPPFLDELGLVAALKEYFEPLARRVGISIDVTDGSDITGLTAEAEITVFRVAQEAVTNVIRHAHASRVTVRLRLAGKRLELAVRDDGDGFDVSEVLESAAEHHLGLFGMRERVRMLGGDLEIESNPGRGTEIRARVPLGVTS